MSYTQSTVVCRPSEDFASFTISGPFEMTFIRKSFEESDYGHLYLTIPDIGDDPYIAEYTEGASSFTFVKDQDRYVLCSKLGGRTVLGCPVSLRRAYVGSVDCPFGLWRIFFLMRSTFFSVDRSFPAIVPEVRRIDVDFIDTFLARIGIEQKQASSFAGILKTHKEVWQTDYESLMSTLLPIAEKYVSNPTAGLRRAFALARDADGALLTYLPKFVDEDSAQAFTETPPYSEIVVSVLHDAIPLYPRYCLITDVGPAIRRMLALFQIADNRGIQFDHRMLWRPDCLLWVLKDLCM